MTNVTDITQERARRYRQFRSALVRRGETVAELAATLETDPSNLRRAIRGEWQGPRAAELTRRALAHVGMTTRGSRA